MQANSSPLWSKRPASGVWWLDQVKGFDAHWFLNAHMELYTTAESLCSEAMDLQIAPFFHTDSHLVTCAAVGMMNRIRPVAAGTFRAHGNLTVQSNLHGCPSCVHTSHSLLEQRLLRLQLIRSERVVAAALYFQNHNFTCSQRVFFCAN